MDENDYGSRDQKGHYIPNELNIKNPLWINPLNIKKIRREGNKHTFLKCYPFFKEK